MHTFPNVINLVQDLKSVRRVYFQQLYPLNNKRHHTVTSPEHYSHHTIALTE